MIRFIAIAIVMSFAVQVASATTPASDAASGAWPVISTGVSAGASSGPSILDRKLPASSPLLLNLNEWMNWQAAESTRRLFANISPSGAAKGAVIASPSRDNPNYFYVWTRDAAITMNAVLDLADDALSAGDQATATANIGRMYDYVDFVSKQQATISDYGLGLAKFEADGSPFQGHWCNPQNDGPALRSAVLIRFANHLLASNRRAYVTSQLYDGTPRSAIKADLEFVAHHWRDVNCEPWEEVYGHHFYNLMVQRRALLDGSVLARTLGDGGAASFYAQQASAIAVELTNYWSGTAFIPTLGRAGGIDYKNSGLDSSTVLAVLHSAFEPTEVPLVSFDDPKLLSTMSALTNAFRNLYAINSTIQSGVAIGRYPEDVYGGTNFLHGNPWVLITAAFANASYRVALAKAEAGDVATAKAYFAAGDSYMERVQVHANPDGSFSEQIDRDSGYQIGARDLTWSHVEVIQAVRVRALVSRQLLTR